MKRLKISRVPRFHPNCVPLRTRHSLCCNGRTRQRFSSALCGGRSPMHGRLLAAPGIRGSPLCVMGNELRFVRIIVLGHLILMHRRQKTCAQCASQDETTNDCSTGNGKNQGLACRNLDWTILALLGEIWYRIDAASGGKALTTNTGGCSLPVPECRVRRFSCRFVLPRTLKGGKGG